VTLAPSNLPLARCPGLLARSPSQKSRLLARSAMFPRAADAPATHVRPNRAQARTSATGAANVPAKYARSNRAQTRSSAASGASRRRSRGPRASEEWRAAPRPTRSRRVTLNAS